MLLACLEPDLQPIAGGSIGAESAPGQGLTITIELFQRIDSTGDERSS